MPVKRIAILSVFGIIVIAGVYALLSAVLKPVEIRAERVSVGVAVETVYATGFVEARERRSLRAERLAVIDKIFETAPGGILREGDPVKAGDPILRLRDSTLEAQLEAARAELRRVSEQLAEGSPYRRAFELRIEEASELAEDERTREQRLRQQLATGAISRDAYDLAKTRADTAAQRLGQLRQEYEQVLADLAAARTAAQSRRDSLLAQQRDNVIAAPIDGVILRLPLKAGEFAAAGAEVALVGDIRELILEAEVNEDDIPRVGVGDAVMIRLAGYDHVSVGGRIYEILPDADRLTRGYIVRVSFDDSQFIAGEANPLLGRTRLPGDIFPRSGMTAELGVVVARNEGAVVFPRAALTANNTVFVVRGSRVAEVRVSPGLMNFSVVEALSGLEDGDRVAVTGLRDLSDGRRVRIRE